MFYKYIPEIARALNELTKTSEDDLKKKLEKLVLEKLKLDEAKDAKELKQMQDQMDNDSKSSISEENIPGKKSKKKVKK